MSKLKFEDRKDWKFWGKLIDNFLDQEYFKEVSEDNVLLEINKFVDLSSFSEINDGEERVILRTVTKLIMALRRMRDEMRKKIEAHQKELADLMHVNSRSNDLDEKIKTMTTQMSALVEREHRLKIENDALRRELEGKGPSGVLSEGQSSGTKSNDEKKVDEDYIMGGRRGLSNDLTLLSLDDEEMPPLTQSLTSEKIATLEQIMKVKNSMKIEDGKLFSRVAFEFAITCASKSTSAKGKFSGSFVIANMKYSRSDIAFAITSSGITVRQFCAAYANLVWNYFLRRGHPPENWRDKGFTEETKFAAFDFFYAVGSNSAIPTEKNGDVVLIRIPTKEENEANDAIKLVKIMKSRAQNTGHVTSSAYYNRGVSYPQSNSVPRISDF